MSISGSIRLSAVGLLAGLAIAAQAQPRVTVIRAGAYVDAQGELAPDALIVVRDNLIVQIGGEPPSGAPVVDFAGAVISPGLIDASAALGAVRTSGDQVVSDLGETTSVFEQYANARDAFDRYHPQLVAALHAGVTTFALSPDDQNLVGGRIAICQTYGPGGAPALLGDGGPLKLSLSSDAFKRDREPTSRGGAVALLRSRLSQAQESSTDEPLVQLVRGRLIGILAAPTAADVLTALDLIDTYKLKLTLVHEHDARELADRIADRGIGVIVGPYDGSSATRDVMAAGIFERSGVEVAIAGGLPARSADSLRSGAALATRQGLSLPAARRAITIAPARFLGMQDAVGSIQKGFRADLVVFSHDPLDLRARVLAVFVNGERVSGVGGAAE